MEARAFRWKRCLCEPQCLVAFEHDFRTWVYHTTGTIATAFVSGWQKIELSGWPQSEPRKRGRSSGSFLRGPSRCAPDDLHSDEGMIESSNPKWLGVGMANSRNSIRPLEESFLKRDAVVSILIAGALT